MIDSSNLAEISVKKVTTISKKIKKPGEPRSRWTPSDTTKLSAALYDGVDVININNLFPLRTKGAIQKKAQTLGYRLEKGKLYHGITCRNRRTNAELEAANIASLKVDEVNSLVDTSFDIPTDVPTSASIPTFMNGLNKYLPVFPILNGASL